MAGNYTFIHPWVTEPPYEQWMYKLSFLDKGAIAPASASIDVHGCLL
jgi:hypothetical protein